MNFEAILAQILLFSVIFSGCQGDPNASLYPKNKPSQEEFVGLWTVKTGETKSEIKLSNDGIFSADEFPNDEFTAFGITKKKVSGEGTWEFKKHQDFWVLRIIWNSVNGKEIKFGTVLHIIHDGKGWKILKILGDPDEGRTIEYSRSKLDD